MASLLVLNNRIRAGLFVGTMALLSLCSMQALAGNYFENFESPLASEWETHGAAGWSQSCGNPSLVSEGDCSYVSAAGALPLRLELESCDAGVLSFDTGQFISGEFSVWVNGIKVISRTDPFAVMSALQINLPAGDHVIAFDHIGSGKVTLDNLSFTEVPEATQCEIDAGCHPATQPFDTVVVVGDSFGNFDADPASYNYPNYMLAPTHIDNYAVAGTSLNDAIQLSLPAALATSIDADSVIIQGGLNDLIWWDGVTPDQAVVLAGMQSAVMSMTNEVLQRDLDPLFISILPWKTDVWVWNEDKQQITTDYNAWLQRYALLTGAVFVDAYTLMEGGPGNEDKLNPVFNNGTNHTNEAGAQFLAVEVDRLIELYRATQ